MTADDRIATPMWARIAVGDVDPETPSPGRSRSARPSDNPEADAAEEARLTAWLDAYRGRMEDKRAAMEEANHRRVRRAGEEIDRWESYRKEEAAKEARALAAAEEAEREAARLKRQEEEEEAKKSYIERNAAHMTEEEKARWLADEAELERLQAELESRDGRLGALNTKIGGWVAEYEARVAAEEQARIDAIHAAEREFATAEAAREAHRQAALRASLDALDADIVAAEAAAREQLEATFRDGAAAIRSLNMQQCRAAMAADDAAKLAALPPPKQDEVLADILEINALRAHCRKLEAGGKSA